MIRLAPIVQYSPLLPPVGVWTVSQYRILVPSACSTVRLEGRIPMYWLFISA